MQLKKAMTSAPVLAIPNFREPFVLETDAFGSSNGTVLSQSQHPIAYFSKLSPRMQKQSTYTREFYAITEAMAKFRHYLLGHKFIIRTDQKSLKELLEQTLQTPEQQQWLPKFLGYDFTIQYKPGRENISVDALSRSLFIAWSEPTNHWLAKVAAVTKEDKLLSELISHYAHGGTIDPKYDVKDGLTFRLMIPENSALRN